MGGRSWEEGGARGEALIEDGEDAGEGAIGESGASGFVGVGAVGEEVGLQSGEDVGIVTAPCPAGRKAEGMDERIAAEGVDGGGDGAGGGLFDGGDDLRKPGAVEDGDDEEQEFVGGEGAEDVFVVADEVFEDVDGAFRDEVQDEGRGEAGAEEISFDAEFGDVVGLNGAIGDVWGDNAGLFAHDRAVSVANIVMLLEAGKIEDCRTEGGVGYPPTAGHEKIDGVDGVVVQFVDFSCWRATEGLEVECVPAMKGRCEAVVSFRQGVEIVFDFKQGGEEAEVDEVAGGSTGGRSFQCAAEGVDFFCEAGQRGG